MASGFFRTGCFSLLRRPSPSMAGLTSLLIAAVGSSRSGSYLLAFCTSAKTRYSGNAPRGKCAKPIPPASTNRSRGTSPHLVRPLKKSLVESMKQKAS
ncbi:hypothetical protein BU26DRAFT_106126 [Trematosphaeria pertusa]|uniref:Uncharacterized protein n=1 Tax=Trematosphaeria pertusa TaxID=390896 RepID=A0A6A6I231_9PLEO|nr:uncharacterized protein BU26DRAFT_106126 [Trematosphaeria pertusa]KAF2243630.1 hypothetical protein BU26DRAFT_106126 [Trematosphaeria pertusa]